MIGKLIGNYKVLEKLSESEASATYKAVDVRRDREVTIKVRTTREIAALNGKMQLSIWENSDCEATIDSIDIAGDVADASSVNNRFSTASITFAAEPKNDKKLNEPKQRTKKSGRTAKSRLRPLLAGAAILTVVVFHSFSQLTFLQTEISELEAASPKIKSEPAAAAEIPPTEFAAKRPNSRIELPLTTAASEPTLPKVTPAPAVVRRPEREKVISARNVLPVARKKETERESRAARLRRAERILTGV